MPFQTPKQRTRARVVQALYQWQVSGSELSQIEQQFLNQKEGRISKALFSNLFQNIPKNIKLLNDLINTVLIRKIDELGCVERSILYLGTYELKFQPETPYKIIINEAIILTKLYGAQDAYKLVNTALDKLAQKLRTPEFQAQK